LRTAILANTLPAALPIYEELARHGQSEVFVVLCPAADSNDLLKHAGRLVLKTGRSKSINLLRKRKLIILRRPLDHPRSLARLTRLAADVALHKTGNIYRESTINCFRLGILNAHIGLLPAYRGRSVAEWAVLEGQPVGISVFFIDTGIDTGKRIVLREEVDVSHCANLNAAKQYLFNLDALFYRQALELLASGEASFISNDESGRRFFVMSNFFKEVAGKIFSAGKVS
jgi:methionyl-tRNA formyltransferase